MQKQPASVPTVVVERGTRAARELSL